MQLHMQSCDRQNSRSGHHTNVSTFELHFASGNTPATRLRSLRAIGRLLLKFRAAISLTPMQMAAGEGDSLDLYQPMVCCFG
jgi:hypothetical protein